MKLMLIECDAEELRANRTVLDALRKQSDHLQERLPE